MGDELDNLYSQIELLNGEIELQERNYKQQYLNIQATPS
jgi:hypothetical protein